MRAWYVVKAKPRQEEQVSAVLGLRGIEVFLPELAVWTGGPRPGAAPRLEPLFPGYLFARLDLRTPEWLTARAAPGVAYFLGAEGVPSAVPDDLVEGVRARAEAQRRRGWRTPFQAGDRVLIASGPLVGLEAVFDGMLSASGRSRVFVAVLSRLVPVTVPIADLRRAG